MLKSEAQNKDLKKQLEESEAQNNELKKKLEQSVAQNKVLAQRERQLQQRVYTCSSLLNINFCLDSIFVYLCSELIHTIRYTS